MKGPSVVPKTVLRLTLSKARIPESYLIQGADGIDCKVSLTQTTPFGAGLVAQLVRAQVDLECVRLVGLTAVNGTKKGGNAKVVDRRKLAVTNNFK